MVENESIDNLVTLGTSTIHDSCPVQIDIDQGALLALEYTIHSQYAAHRTASPESELLNARRDKQSLLIVDGASSESFAHFEDSHLRSSALGLGDIYQHVTRSSGI